MAMQCSSFVGPRGWISGNKAALLIGLAVTLAGSDCLATTRTWTGASINDPSPANRNNFWTTPANWSGNAFPVPGDDLVFPTSAFQAASNNNFSSGLSFGKITIENHSIIGANIVLTNGISATGGLISLNGIKIANLQTFTVPGSSSSVLIASPIDTNGQELRLNITGTIVLTGAIGNTGNVNQLGSGGAGGSGTGTSVFTGANTFAGCTVSSGTMLVAGQQPTVPVDVHGSGRLAGNGTVGSIFMSGSSGEIATISPGNDGPSILNAAAGVEFANNSSLAFSRLAIDLNGKDVGTGYDRLDVTGTVNLHTTTQLAVTIAAGFVPAPGDTFIIIKNDGTDAVLGNFIGSSQPIPEGSLITVGSTSFQISYVGGDGNDITLTVVNGVTAFTATSFSVNEGDGNASITLHRAGGGNTTATVGVALEDITTSPADYVSPAGKLDTSFNAGAGPNAIVLDLAVQSDGKILIVGDFTSVAGTDRARIARLNTDGSLDTTFDPGLGADNRVSEIVVQPDGKILIAGRFFNYNGTQRFRVARLLTSGALDTTFDPLAGPDLDVNDLALQGDGKILIGGQFSNYRGVPRKGVARLNSDGTLDTSFDPGAGQNGAGVFGLALDADGKILVAGKFDDFAGSGRAGVVRLNSNGSVDTSFNPGTGTLELVEAVTVQPDGRVLIGGRFVTFNGTQRVRLARLEGNGAIDTSFDPGAGVDDGVGKILLQRDGKPVVTGSFGNFGTTSRAHILRLNTNGSLDETFNPGTGTNFQVVSIAFDGTGRFIAGGLFSQYNGLTRQKIARVQGDLVAFWAANDFADKTIQLPIVNDTVFEGDEKVRLRIVPLTAGLAAPSTAELTIVENDPIPPMPAKALNIATRLRVETGDNVMIAGFILTGNVSKDVVLRGMGAVLGNFGITDFLADPVLDLRGPGGPILANNNWKDTQRAQIEGTPFEPGDDRESVIVATLPPANYSAILTGNNNTTGVGVIEVFDNNSAADSQLGNISTRGLVQGNNSVMIGGFILGGSTSNSRIAIRGIGPSLAQFGLNNVLADPTLELHDGNGALLISNDNWESDATSAGQLSANGLGLSDPKESGIFTSLPVGQFTAILAGKDGGTGIGLIEIYNLQ
jgi:uncharacterized delta-60 repeat protein